MSLRTALAAIIRLTRAARGLSQEQLTSAVESRHLHNLEHAKSSVTVDTLENIALRLDVDMIALLALAARYEHNLTSSELITYIEQELAKLDELNVFEKIDGQFENGELKTRRPGNRTVSQETIDSIRTCKAQGMTQKEIRLKLGIPATTVNRIWHSDSDA